jgi:hypothetical protein
MTKDLGLIDTKKFKGFEQSDLGKIHGEIHSPDEIKLWIVTTNNSHRLVGVINKAAQKVEVWNEGLEERIINWTKNYFGRDTNWIREYPQNRVKFPEPTHESPNDIFCPRCDSYKEKYISDNTNPVFNPINRCPDCKSEVKIG